MPETLKRAPTGFSLLLESIDVHLAELLPAENTPPEILHQAMRYSVMAGGKRVRPMLAISAFQSSGGVGEVIYPVACALEFLHTYSLIHDDLPCMDDDDFRRGQPTLHRKYPEYIAVLAGDALHALAFELLATCGNAEIVREVSRAIGTQGMIGGQVRDVQAEGKAVSLEDVEAIHRHKTAALICASTKVGGMLAGAPPADLLSLELFGQRLGLAFQIVDDILDVEGDPVTLGKSIGSDDRLEKATYPKVVGLEKSRQIASRLISEGKAFLTEYPGKETLGKLADYILEREG